MYFFRHLGYYLVCRYLVSNCSGYNIGKGSFNDKKAANFFVSRSLSISIHFVCKIAFSFT